MVESVYGFVATVRALKRLLSSVMTGRSSASGSRYKSDLRSSKSYMTKAESGELLLLALDQLSEARETLHDLMVVQSVIADEIDRLKDLLD